MQNGGDLLVFKRRLDLAEAGRDQPGLAGDSQCVEGGSLQEMLGTGDQIRRQANIPLEAAGENFAFDGLVPWPRGWP